MRTRNKLLTSALVVAALGSVAALGVFGLFSATTQNSGNEISAGTVVLTDNDAGSAMFNITGVKPGESWTRCLKVTYNGSLPADIHQYESGRSGPLAPYMHLVLEQGTQPGGTFPSCSGFIPDGAGPSYDGPAFDALAVNFETGWTTVPHGQTLWNPGDSVVYKMIMSLDANAPVSVQGSSTGTFSNIYEARSH
jgi:camelysin-like metallo-endopeptidase